MHIPPQNHLFKTIKALKNKDINAIGRVEGDVQSNEAHELIRN